MVPIRGPARRQARSGGRYNHEATPFHAPINLPFYNFFGGSFPLAIVQADRADADEQLPPAEEDEQASVVSHRNPSDQLPYSSIPRT